MNKHECACHDPSLGRVKAGSFRVTPAAANQ